MAGGHPIEERAGEEGGGVCNHGRKPGDKIKDNHSNSVSRKD